MKAIINKRILSAFLLFLVLVVSASVPVYAISDVGGTTVSYPNEGYVGGPPGAIYWTQRSDAKAAQLFIGSYDGTFSWNSGPIYTNAGLSNAWYSIPASVQASIPKGKSLLVGVETYHYSGNTYLGWASDTNTLLVVN
ncbi:hypothetical protein [Paenibacillus sp. IHBB 10380]|uniref:hypothetical protein n=1 Tax=Paenibacillus sp. IHBB 10380 TaxID=1566358 RepID=UPI0005CFA315|nr:hypothetical protein [Paenibacillus sp. IHBB 10380]AJS59340.1 hypothetical protein UB51_13660 [Paenibacillus sp. IHBB 10380]